MAKIMDIEGIGPKYAAKLQEIGIKICGAITQSRGTTERS